MKTKDMELARIVRALRVANKWGAPALAERLKKAGWQKASATSVQGIEKGSRPGQLRELALAFDKTVDELYAWEPGMPILGPNEGKSGAAQDLAPDPVIRQLQNMLWNVIEVFSVRTQGAAAELKARLDDHPDLRLGDEAFHERLLSTLRTIVQTQKEAAGLSEPSLEHHASSRKTRKT